MFELTIDTKGSLPPGSRLGSYQIGRLLGRGGMAEVHEAVHLGLGKKVAIKTLRPGFAQAPDAGARFLREARLTSALRHPHVVDVTDVGIEGDCTYMVMELLEGEPLSARISRGPLPVEEAISILIPVASAVVAAHEQNVIHRDLKPENIFLTTAPDGGTHPKVLDFGISKRLGSAVSQSIGGATTGTIWGSPRYFAPEQLDDTQTVGAAADQYGLGVVLYEMLTGQTPFSGSDLPSLIGAIVQGRYVPATSLRPELPDGLDQVVGRAMSVSPAARYASVKDFGRMLLVFASLPTRMRWSEAFLDEVPILTPAAADIPSPVPVTDQTPAVNDGALTKTAFFSGGVRLEK